MPAPDPVVLVLVTSDSLWAHAEAIRTRVFVEEQACPPDEEWDAFDDWAGGAVRHFVLFVGGEPVATARWHPAEHAGHAVAKLERFAVLPEFRGQGLGRTLVARVLADAEESGHARFVLHAQAHLERFYGTFGFQRDGLAFLEAGIVHVPMSRG